MTAAAPLDGDRPATPPPAPTPTIERSAIAAAETLHLLAPVAAGKPRDPQRRDEAREDLLVLSRLLATAGFEVDAGRARFAASVLRRREESEIWLRSMATWCREVAGYAPGTERSGGR